MNKAGAKLRQNSQVSSQLPDKVQVRVYLDSNNIHEYVVGGLERAREHAKRIVTEGFWLTHELFPEYCEEGQEHFIPVHRVYKVSIKVERNDG